MQPFLAQNDLDDCRGKAYTNRESEGKSMRLIPLEELHRHDIRIPLIRAMALHPVNQVYRQPSGGRKYSILMLLEEGRFCLEFQGKKLEIEPGTMVYLPEGGEETYRGMSDNIFYRWIGFRMLDANNEVVRCAEEPLILNNAMDETIIGLCRKLPEAFLTDFLSAYSLLYQLLSLLSRRHGENVWNSMQNRVMPAIQYLEKNYYREILSADLAQMCNLSETHFRRLFKECTGVSPMSYRNQLRIRLACRLLQGGQCSITEIADQLGFENINYFSRVFKEIKGVSPTKWRRED